MLRFAQKLRKGTCMGWISNTLGLGQILYVLKQCSEKEGIMNDYESKFDNQIKKPTFKVLHRTFVQFEFLIGWQILPPSEKFRTFGSHFGKRPMDIWVS